MSDSAGTPAAPGGGAPSPPDNPTRTDEGFSTVEKLAGAAAAYRAPLASSVAASAMLRNETDPERRRQLEKFRSAALLWWGLGIVAAIVGLIVVLSFASSHGLGGSGGGCRGGIDTMDEMGTTYQSVGDDGWTATYPCIDGGTTTVPIAPSLVPGGGN